MKYNAFISYRHAPLDMEVAKKLHKTLETYHIPASVQKKTGKKRINRVFRDQEELPIGSDLNDNISAALMESEFLIVICSQDTPESYWVLKEIETFIQMHDRDHVLAILVDGEPWNAFPAPLLTDENGNPVEPLAADIRGANASERNKKFSSEFLRIAAPVIGCTYDDLKQRHKERIIKRNLSIGFAAVATLAVFGTAFGIYNAITASRMKKLAEEKEALANEKTKLAGEILLELQGKQVNQSRFYAEESSTLLRLGNREDAVLVALEALPSEENERPFVSEAEYALSEALYTYDAGDYLKFDKTLGHDYRVYDTFFNEDQSLLISTGYSQGITIWETENYTRLVSLPSLRDKDGNKIKVKKASADRDFIYAFSDYYMAKVNYDGVEVKGIKLDESIKETDIHLSEKKAYVLLSDRLLIVDLDSFKVSSVIKNTLDDSYYGPFLLSKTDPVAAFALNSTDTEYPCLLNLETGEQQKLDFSGENVAHIHFTEKGNLVVLSADGDFFSKPTSREFLDVYSPSGKKLWSRELENCKLIPSYPIMNLLDSLTYSEDDTEKSIIIASVQYDSYVIDEDTGETVSTFTHNAPISGMVPYRSSVPMAYMSFTDGEIAPVNLKEGSFYTQYSMRADFSIMDLLCKKSDWTFIALEYNSPNLHTLKYVDNPSLVKLDFADENFSGSVIDTSENGSCFVFENFTKNDSYEFYNSDGELLYSLDTENYYVVGKEFINDRYYIITNQEIIAVDPVGKRTETLLKLADFGISFVNNAFLSKDGKYAVIVSGKELAFLNVDNASFLAGIALTETISHAYINSDAGIVFTTFENDRPHAFELATANEIKMDIQITSGAPQKEDLLKPTADFSTTTAYSSDGNYLAVYCDDGYIRILPVGNSNLNAITIQDAIRFDAVQNFYMSFTPDNKTLIIQGDDYRIYFYDLEKKTFTNSFAADMPAQRSIYDSEDRLLAIGDRFNLYLFNTNDYGVLASVPHAVCFLTENNTFITLNNKALYKIQYRDYKELMAMAKEAFPDAVLTDEKKIAYNIN